MVQTQNPIDTAVAIGQRRAAVASALGSNALESQTFNADELAIVEQYVDGQIDSDTMREKLLALPV